MKVLNMLILFSALALIALPSISSARSKNSLLQNASFDATWSRYPSPDMVIEFMRRIYPHANYAYNNVGDECLALNTIGNRTLLGDSDPANGKPVLKQPNGGFVNWYTTCVGKLIYSNFDSNFALFQQMLPSDQIKMINDDFSPLLSQECIAQSTAGVQYPMNYVYLCPWAQLSTSAKLSMIHAAINRFIGPDEIVSDLGIAADAGALSKIILDEIESFAQSPDKRFSFLNVNLEQKKMTAYDATKIAHFLVLMTEVLKY